MPHEQTALELAVRQLFEPASADYPGGVGVEVECFPLRFREGMWSAADVDELHHLLDAPPSLIREGGVSFEPGGQLELSPPPAASPAALLRRVADLLARVEARAATGGFRLETGGVNRRLSCAEIGLRRPIERYRKMQAHFDAIGADGRRMMRQTASLQVCLDLLPGVDGREQWSLLNEAGPALAAAFATSPVRARIWRGVDPSRTGLDGRHLAGDPIAGYAAFARDAEAIPLDVGRDDVGPFRRRFGEWMAAGGSRPDAADLVHHLSTLFPPVRPRGGYLEVRYLDALPWRLLPVPVCLLAALVFDPTARRTALAALRARQPSIADAWRRCAAAGRADRDLAETAAELFDLAAAGARRLPAGYLPDDAAAAIRAYAVDRHRPATDPALPHQPPVDGASTLEEDLLCACW